MKTKLNSILLIDDNEADNHYHQMLIEKMNIAVKIMFAESGIEALNYLKNKNQIYPELIFLDINMPKMNGWEFLKAIKNLSPVKRKQIIIIMLSTSVNPDDIKKSKTIPEVTNFIVKPLTEETIKDIMEQHFSDIKYDQSGINSLCYE